LAHHTIFYTKQALTLIPDDGKGDAVSISDQPVTAATIDALLAGYLSRNDRVTFVVDRSLLITRTATVPCGSDAEMHGMLLHALADLVPFPIESASIACKVCSGVSGMSAPLVFCAKNEAITTLFSWSETHPNIQTVIIPAALILARIAPVTLAIFGQRGEYTVADNGVPEFSRSFPFSDQEDFKRELSDSVAAFSKEKGRSPGEYTLVQDAFRVIAKELAESSRIEHVLTFMSASMRIMKNAQLDREHAFKFLIPAAHVAFACLIVAGAHFFSERSYESYLNNFRKSHRAEMIEAERAIKALSKNNNLMQRRISVSQLVADIIQAMPSSVRFVTFDIKNGLLLLRCNAQGIDDAFSFSESMKKIVYIKDVSVKNIRQNSTDGQNQYEFVIEANLAKVRKGDHAV